MYIIYRDGKFAGFTEDKKMFNEFMSVRKDGKYTFKKMKKSKLPKRIRESDKLENYSMEYYIGYRIVTGLPLFLYEFEELDSDLGNDMLTLSESVYFILSSLKYLKLSKEEKMIITESMNHIDYLISGVITHEPVFDEIIDIEKYINHNKKNKNKGFAKLEHRCCLF